MRIAVECYSGYRGEETPRWIVIGNRRLAVDTIIDRWLAPLHRYFKCQTVDGAVWIIRHDIESQQWELTHFKDKEANKRLAESYGGEGYG